MRFGEAHWLQLLWLLPFLGALAWWYLRKREADLRAWCGPALWTRMVPGRQRWAAYLKAFLLIGAVFFLILAAARPQIGSRVRTVTRQGIDVVVALDVSESMLAEDLAPNRITRAQQEIQSLLERLRGDRVGLVAFAGDAFVQCPLTLDYAAARLFLRLMNTDLVPVPGTGLARAIEVATGAFDEDETQFKALVLITDGEDHEGRMMEAAEEAKKQGVRIFAVGIGSEQGEPIPIRDASGQVKDYKRDDDGEVILTRQDPAALMEVCEMTKGRYFDGTSGSLALDQLYDAIASLEEREMEGGVVTQYEDRYGYFAAVALLLLVLEWFWSERTRVRRGRARTSSAAAVMLVCAASAGGMGLVPTHTWAADDGRKHYEEGDYEAAREAYETYSAEHPEDPRGYYNLGTTLHQAGELNPAQFALRRATAESDPAVQAQALYNLGNTQAKMGDLQGARDSYREALKLDPADRDTKINLEIVNRLLESAPPDSSQQQQQQQGQNSQDPEDESDEQQDSQDQNSQDQEPQDEESQDRQNPQESDSKNDAEEQQQSSEGSESPEEQQTDSENPQEQQSDEDPQSGDEPPSQDPQSAKQDDLKISPEEARRLLEALGQQEQQIQAERMKARAKDVKVEKDW